MTRKLPSGLLLILLAFSFLVVYAHPASALLGPCKVCTPSIPDPCSPTYSSPYAGCTYGLACRAGHTKWYCMSWGADTCTSSSTTECCIEVPGPAVAGKTYKDPTGAACATPVPTATVPCSDPDGEDAYTYGTCVPATGKICLDGRATCNDYCSVGYDNRVNEYVCDTSGGCDSKILTCNTGDKCVDGKCVPAVPCTDSDGGKDYYTLGTCKDGSGCSTTPWCVDSCVSTFGLKEYYCSGNSCLSETIPCPGGAYCAYGVCEPVTPVPTIGPTPSGSCTDPDNTDIAKPIGSRTDIYTKTSCISTKNCASPGCSDMCIGDQLDEIYCDGKCKDNVITCPIGYTCKDGVCKSGTVTPVPTPVGGGCHYWASNFGVCASGCPPEKWDMNWMCCEEAGASSGCEGDSGPGCVGWNPAIGETPCCSADGYRVCSSTQECIDGDCVDICTNPAYSKYTEPYCSKCSHCVDGLLNCGEPEIDKCGKPCTLVQTQTCITPPSYGKGSCDSIGKNKCDYYCPGTYGTTCVRLVSCAYDEYACIYECTKTVDVFNQDSCYDGVQNCGEPCLDGGPNCVSGTETGYAPTYDVEQSTYLSNTIFYVDANILCSDGIDNDHDCAIDCDDSDCAAVPVCQDTIPPTVTIEAPLKGVTIWNPATIKVSAYDDKRMTTSYIVVKMDGVPIHQFLPGECWGSGKKTNPYRCTWTWAVTPAQMGQRILQAEAKDWKSNLGTSDAISVTVGCASTFDCVTRYGPKNYCPGTTHVCTPCLRDQDFYCPDLECLNVDLDCCSTTVSCPSGLYCELGENTCYAKRGNFCSKQEDCKSGEYCSLDAQVCVNNNFIFLKPHFLKAKVGTIEALQVVMSDPVNRTGSYDLSISGTGKNYAKFFGTQTRISVTLKAGEVKTIPVIFSAGAIGTYTLEVEAIDTVYYRDSTNPPGGIRSVPSPNTKASVTVETDTKTPFLVSSPGPTIPGLLALALLASLFIFHGGRRK